MQGQCVSLSADGNTAIVGGNFDDSNTGAVWVYTRSNGVWSQQGSKLVGTGAVGGAYQGESVALSADGNTAIVGGWFDNGAGAAWVYTRAGGVWTQQGSKLVGAGAWGNAQQGVSVSLSADGNTAIIGGHGDSNFVGAAWIFVRSGGVWTQQGGKLVGTGGVGTFLFQGASVAISADGNTAIVSGYGDSNYIGAAWVYTRSGGVWTQEGSKLVGADVVGILSQGVSVSLSADGNTAVLGRPGDNGNTGAIWVFSRSGGLWTQQGTKLVGTGAVGGAGQGISVSLSADGRTALVGGAADNAGEGAAWVYGSTYVLEVVVNAMPRWNLMSLPVGVGNDSVSSLFPSRTSNAFAYTGSGYQIRNKMIVGTGYWLKFSLTMNKTLTGLPVTSDTVTVSPGWNLIGSLSVPLAVSSITSDPPGMIASSFFGYDGAYRASDTLHPGGGYWVKVNQDGKLILRAGGSSSLSKSNSAERIRIVPTDELPPSAPETDGIPIKLPREFALAQNYPNPFNPMTTVRFALPVSGHVRLSVYNMLGQEVAMLVDGVEYAGYKSISFDASRLSSGIYIYMIKTQTFTDVKKMVLIK
jgi:hypothetical protein